MSTVAGTHSETSAHAQMHAALESMQRGHAAEAISRTRALLAESPGEPEIWLVAGIVLFVGRAYDASFDALAGATRRGAGAPAFSMLFDRAKRLGREALAREALEGLGRDDELPVWSTVSTPHDADDDDLREASHILRGGPGAASRELGRDEALARSSTLSEVELDHFVEHGYIRLPGALSRAWIEARREAAYARLPELIGGARGARFERDRAGTWPNGVVTCAGTSLTSARMCAPRMWGAVCDLLGGAERVGTHKIADQFVVRFPARALSRLFSGRGSSWHVDDPGRIGGLGAIETGVIALALCSDVEPEGGETWLAGGSVAEVVRTLTRTKPPPTLDRREAARIARKCTSRIRCTGETGDVYLVHPLMVHSGTLNRARAIRWLANWMFYPSRPLDPRSPDALSPVERAIAAHL